jgi:apolipoprotein N-acyltransferase
MRLFVADAGLGGSGRLRAPSVAVALAGGVQALAYSPQALGLQSAWWLQWVAVLVLAGCVSRVATPQRGAWLGWLYGTAWLTVATAWLYISMHRYGGLSSGLAGAAVLALSAFLSLYLAASMAAFVVWRTGRAGVDALLFAALWLVAEWARGVLFTGFPWAAAGYAYLDSPVAALAPWCGVYGIGALAAGLAAWVALARAWPGRGVAVVAFGLVWGALLALGARDFTTSTGTVPVTLLQGNVPQNEKFLASNLVNQLTWYGRALQQAGAGLVVAPETAIPLLPSMTPDGYWYSLRAAFDRPDRAALVGVPLGDDGQGYTNSVVGLSPQTLGGAMPRYQYSKHHLVPFGEFIPTGFHWFVRLMNIPLGDFDRGDVNQASFSALGQRIAPNICYEDVFGEELAVRLVDEVHAPTVFANLSNIGWFGRSLAVEQHLQMSRMRALELQRPMIRATNTGATVVIDHRGRVTASLAPYTQGVLRASVEGRSGITPFAWWAGRWGLWPLLGLALFVIALIRRVRRSL